MTREAALPIKSKCQHEGGVQPSEREQVECYTPAQQPVLSHGDQPVAVGDTGLGDAVRRRQLDLRRMVMKSSRYRHAHQPTEDRHSCLACDDDNRSDDRSKVRIPDLAANDHNGKSAARAAAASSILFSSSVKGFSAYPLR